MQKRNVSCFLLRQPWQPAGGAQALGLDRADFSTLWPWENSLTPFSLSFLIHAVGILIGRCLISGMK